MASLQNLQTQLDNARTRAGWVNAAGNHQHTWEPDRFLILDDSGKDRGDEFHKRYSVGDYAAGGKILPDPFNFKYCFSSEELVEIAKKIETYIASLTADIAKLSADYNKKHPDGAQKNADGTVAVPTKDGPLTYNVGSVKSSYYANGINKMAGFNSTGNTPKIDVQNAWQLWNTSANHKGMISTWNRMNTSLAIPGTGIGATDLVFDSNRYAFQFLYNPMTVEMAYSGAPAVDVTMFTSGREEFAPWAGSGGGGTITFDIILNRMPDMAVYNNKGELQVKNAYVTRQPYGKNDSKSKTMFNEQEAIYNRGTMYDVEFLLRTVLGFTMKTEFRGVTADVGWIGAMPIELHLGNGLRYWAVISGLNITHGIFNERMIPVFSTVRIQASRVPDAVSYSPGYTSSTAPENAGGSIWDNYSKVQP